MCRPSIEPRNIYRSGCRRRLRERKATPGASLGRDATGPRGVRDLEHAQKLLTREPGDPEPTRGGWCHGSRWEVGRRKPAMNGHGKSDGCTVPAKPSNKVGRMNGPSDGGPYAGTKAETPETDKGTPKAGVAASQPTAEVVEGRHPAERNLRQQTMHRTQSRERMQRALERVRRAAKQDKELRFTTLLHHICEVDRLREAYLRLKREAAPGVDGETWRHYGEAQETNLQGLSGRLRRGAYRAKPVRRVYRRRHCQGDVRIVRYADDTVIGFEHRHEGEQFLAALRQRLAKFGLELHPDKTRLIEFGRNTQEGRRRRGLE